MSVEENKYLVRRLYEAGNANNFAVLDEIISPDYITYLPGYPQPLRGPEAVKRSIMMNRAAFPDIYVTINDQIAEGDKVVTIWSSRGTNTGPMMGMPPTGKPMAFVGIDIWRIAGGKLVEYFGLQQPFGPPPPMR